MTETGYIYVIAGIHYKKNTYKVGKTGDETEEYLRRRYQTAIGTIDIKYHGKFRNYHEAEKEIFRRLDSWRAEKNHEIFVCPFELINYNLARMDGRYKKWNYFKKKIVKLYMKLMYKCS